MGLQDRGMRFAVCGRETQEVGCVRQAGWLMGGDLFTRRQNSSESLGPAGADGRNRRSMGQVTSVLNGALRGPDPNERQSDYGQG
jgi:hypothetical protein